MRATIVKLSLAVLAGCAIAPGERLARRGDEIVVAGQLFHTGNRVVLWNDPRGYNAYLPHRHFAPEHETPSGAPNRHARFGSTRRRLPEALAERVAERGWTLDDLREVVSQIVIHFDACGTSKRCFEVLHDIRGLSCHFLLDLDGTIYQTLDLKERAWHAAQANDQSIGIEIAHVGAFTSEERLSKTYASAEDDHGARIAIPDAHRGWIPDDFVARPRVATPVRGEVQGKQLVQYDFTEEQYIAIKALLRTLRAVFPRVRADAPRDAEGKILNRAFASDEELFEFTGILGHFHVTTRKIDPGPAFDWERVLEAVR